MSADGSVELDWGDELQRKFRLDWGGLRELQEGKANKARVAIGVAPLGPRGFLRALIAGEELIEDVREIIRISLLRGNKDMAPPEAARLVRQYVEERPLAESVPVAVTVLMAAVVGVPDDPAGKQPAGEDRTMTAPSPSPQSMASGPH